MCLAGWVIAKGLLGVSVWVEILLSKYSYSRSTCNLLRQMRDQGMAISQGTVTDGLKKMVPLFEPLLDQLMQRQMEDSVFHCDETGWKVYEKMEGKIGNRMHLFCRQFMLQSLLHLLDRALKPLLLTHE